jgi:hypothetical protein
MSKSKSPTGMRLLRAGLATGVTITAILGVTAAPAFAEARLTLSQSSGPSGGTNTVTATSSTAIFTPAVTPAVSFQTVGSAGTTLCSPKFTAPVLIAVNGTSPYAQTAGNVGVPASLVRKLTPSKLVITVPNASVNDGVNTTAGLGLGTNQSVGKYNVCVYDGNTVGTSLLIASSTYTIAAKPTITASTGVSPAGGPALGGTTVTVAGTGFTSGLTATLGGQPMTNVVVNAAGTSFSATAPAHIAAANQYIVVNATGGTVSSHDPNNDLDVTDALPFAYSNGITVTPNTAPSGTDVDVDVYGVGFSNMDWTTTDGTTPNSTKAHVYLLSAAYSPADAGASGIKATPEKAECINVLPISDTELICTMNLAGGALSAAAPQVMAGNVPDGIYTVAVVNDGGIAVQPGGASADANYMASVLTSGSVFIIAAY